MTKLFTNLYNRSLDHVIHRSTKTLIDLSAAVNQIQRALVAIEPNHKDVVDIEAVIMYDDPPSASPDNPQ